MNQKYAFITTAATTNPKVVTYGLRLAIAVALAAALALSATVIINPSAAYADWPKSVRYSSETLGGTSIGCESPEECKEGFGTASPNQAAKSSCEERTGQKCKKDK